MSVSWYIFVASPHIELCVCYKANKLTLFHWNSEYLERYRFVLSMASVCCYTTNSLGKIKKLMDLISTDSFCVKMNVLPLHVVSRKQTIQLTEKNGGYRREENKRWLSEITRQWIWIIIGVQKECFATTEAFYYLLLIRSSENVYVKIGFIKFSSQTSA